MTPSSSPAQPLAAAALRLRRRPGRKPRAAAAISTQVKQASVASPQAQKATPGAAIVEGVAPAVTALCPPGALPRRLLKLPEAAAYMGVSTWTIRAWIRAEMLRPVVIRTPSRRGAP